MGKDDKYSGEDEYESGGELIDLAEQPEVDTGTSAVAITPGSRMAVMIAVGIGILAFVYYMFFTGTEQKEDEKKKAEAEKLKIVEVAPPVTPDTGTSVIAPVPALPEPPPISMPTPPAPPKEAEVIPMVPPPPPPSLAPEAPKVGEAAAPVIPEGESEEAKQRRLARMKSGIIISGGGGVGGSAGAGAGGGTGAGAAAGGKEGEAAGGEKKEGVVDELLGVKNKDFGNTDFRLTRTSAAQAEATLIARDMTSVVAQGKIIDAVLETAINTDLPGQLRAVISRDVYAESGKNILLPKGSRLVGNYQADVKRGEQRVQIIWTRAIRPDGIDIAIDSPGTDQLGRSGVDGLVDNRYLELFSNAILLSTITATVAVLAESATGSSGVETTTGFGQTTQSGKPSDFALTQGVQNLGDITKGVGQDLLKTKPTITVEQGTEIKVFVNRDLIFPSSIANSVKFVQ